MRARAQLIHLQIKAFDAIYLNVSTKPGLNPVDVVNWKDDGSHCYCPEDMDVAKFQALKGKAIYWQLIADKKNGQRIKTPVRSCTIGDVSMSGFILNMAYFQNLTY